MKPEEIFFRALPEVIEHITNGREVLLNRAVAALCAIEADAIR